MAVGDSLAVEILDGQIVVDHLHQNPFTQMPIVRSYQELSERLEVLGGRDRIKDLIAARSRTE